MSKPRGVVAAGHTLTAEAAAEVLRAGGNAYDAVLAALMVACVTEPVLCTPGGGGFLLARPASEKPRVYDFFVHTPATRANPKQFPIGIEHVTVNGTAAVRFKLARSQNRYRITS